MAKPLAILLGTLLALALPVLCAIARGAVQDRWLLQDTSRSFVAMAIAAVVFLTILALVLLSLHAHLAAKHWAGLALWALAGAWYAGPLALDVANSVGAQSPGSPVELTVVPPSMRLLVRVGVKEGDALAGTTFTVSKSRWGQPPGAARTAIVRRGRLGLWWAELPLSRQ